MAVNGKSLMDYYYGQFGKKPFYDHVPKSGSDTWVYLVYCYETNLCKIGISNKIKERVQQICCSSGVLCELVFAVQLMPQYDEDPIFIEKSIHTYFKSKRKFGEWFSLSLRDVTQVYYLFFSIEGDAMIDNFRKLIQKRKSGNF